jgi:hypothetical protein
MMMIIFIIIIITKIIMYPVTISVYSDWVTGWMADETIPDIFLFFIVLNGSGAYPAPYPMCAWGKVAEV